MPNASQTLAGGHCVWRHITRASKECRIMGLRYGGLTLPLVSTGMATHMGEVHYSQMVPVVISAAVWTPCGSKIVIIIVILKKKFCDSRSYYGIG